MDYGRIYRELIADRRANPPGENEYTETHHILPRCMGGGDDAANLIRLRPEDHFFAHLLLARIHGTREMWAVVIMYIDRKGGIYRRAKAARHNYGWARRAYAVRLSESLSGDKHPSYDHTIWFWKHLGGREFTGTRHAFAAATGFHPSNITGIINGRVKSHFGWYLDGTDPAKVGKWRRGEHHYNHDPAVYEFRHLDGRAMSATRYQFAGVVGLSMGGVGALIAGRLLSSGGWYLPANGTKVSAVSSGGHKFKAGIHRPDARRDRTVYDFVHENGDTFRGTKFEFASHHRLPVHPLHFLLRGERASFAGWRLAETPAALTGPRKGIRHHFYSAARHRFVHDDGRVEICTQHALCEKHGIDVRNVSAIVKGRRKKAYGWSIQSP